MSLRIHKAIVTLARNQVAAAILYLLMVVEALSVIPIDRKWTPFGANMTEVFGKNFTEVITPHIRICALLAAGSPPANLACHKSSRCVFASVYLPRVGGEQTEGFTCWYSQVCSHEGALVRENENVTVADPACLGTRTLTCSMHWMIFVDVRPPRTTCTAPLTQHSFGCMYDSDFKGNYCKAHRYCEELGANLSSPETAEDTADMRAYYENKHVQKTHYYVGLYRVNGVFRWPANQRDPGPPGTGDWGSAEPNDNANTAVMYVSPNETYGIGDEPSWRVRKALCHVWTTF